MVKVILDSKINIITVLEKLHLHMLENYCETTNMAKNKEKEAQF